MDNLDQQLNDLFQSAREQEPEMAYSKAEERLVTAIGLGMGATLLAWISKSLTTKNLIVMMSSIAILTTATALLLGTLTTENSSETTANHEAVAVEKITSKNHSQVIEIEVEKDLDEVEVPKNAAAEPSLEPKLELENHPMEPKAARDPSGQPAASSSTLNQNQPAPMEYNVPKPKTVNFVVTDKTTEEEWAEIAEQAEKAGVYMTYGTKGKKSTNRKFRIEMWTEDVQGEVKLSNSIKGKGQFFRVKFGWKLDPNGRAFEFTDHELISADTKEWFDKLDSID